ncbi:MAG: metallophosphoesterase [Nanoarchaeota archaeon]
MKILAFTDVHSDKAVLKGIVRKSKNTDILLCSGDLSFFGGGLDESIKILLKAKKKILIIHGNHETEEQISRLGKKYSGVIGIHKRPTSFDDFVFVGYGGDGFSIRDENLERYFDKLKNRLSVGKKLITVTHAPPRNTKLDYIPGFGHVGNMSINKAIVRLKPVLHVCGHIHECFGRRDKIGRTILVNPSYDGRILNI